MRAYERIVEEETVREIESWPDGLEIRTLEPMMRITLNAIIRAVFGADGERHRALAEELRTEMPKMIAVGSRLAGLPFLHLDVGSWSPWAGSSASAGGSNGESTRCSNHTRRDRTSASAQTCSRCSPRHGTSRTERR